MNYILIAALGKLVNADLIDIKKAKERKERQKKEREKQNKELLRRMKYQDKYGNQDEGEEEDEEEDMTEYFDEKTGLFSPEKVWKNKNIPNLKNLGEIEYVYEEEWSDFYDHLSDFLEETEAKEEEIKEDKKVLDDLMKKYMKNKKWRVTEEKLKEVYENQAVDTVYSMYVQYYQLPAKDFGEVNVGPSKNLLEPDEGDIDNAMYEIEKDMLPKNYIVIYSDDKFKYKKMINEMKKEQERLNEAV